MKLDPKSGLYLPEPIRRYSPEEQRRAERKWNRDALVHAQKQMITVQES